MEKKRYEIQIADVDLAILSDEREDFVMSSVDQLDSRIRDLTVRNKRCSKLDAALLCALDYFSDKLKAEKRVRNLEAQISLYDANMRRLREDNLRMKAMLGQDSQEHAETDSSETISAASGKTTPVETTSSEKPPVETASEEKAPAEAAPDKPDSDADTSIEKNAAEAVPSAQTGSEADEKHEENRQLKLRQIENLLRR